MINKREIEYKTDKNGCHICTSHVCSGKEGYKYLIIRINGKKRYYNRVQWAEIYGEIPKGMVIRHKCDNPSCININHLEIGTQKDNIQDCIKRGRWGYPVSHASKHKGIKHPKCKLTEEQVLEIYSDSRKNTIMAKKYNINQATISKIKKGKSWKHLTQVVSHGR